jgi:hypothetical protein
MNPSHSWRGSRCAGIVRSAALVLAAPAELPSIRIDHRFDSGSVQCAPDAPAIVISHLVEVPGALWLRLSFRSIELGELGESGELDELGGCTLRLVSARDGGVQELSTKHCREWRNHSAYFNGDAVLIEVIGEPNGGAARIVLDGVEAGVQPSNLLSVCGKSDDRVLANDRSSARLLPALCTAFLIQDCNHCLLSAGHCAAEASVAEFDVPPSGPTGVVFHPSPDDQYAVDAASLQFEDNGTGADWSYFGCFANPNTGLTPFERQHLARPLAASAPPAASGVTIRITGFGSDLATPSANFAQQTHRGPLLAVHGSALEYAVDTTSGESGAAIHWDQQGVSVGIHTHSGCDLAQTSGNRGTAIDHVALQSALASPRGVCSRSAAAGVYCSAKVNSQGCVPTMQFHGAPSASLGAGSFTVSASSVLNNQLGRLVYGGGPASTPFQGGTLCVGPPIVRAPGQMSGGNAPPLDCSGTYSFDMGAWIASGVDPRLVPGATVCAQFWSRDAHAPIHPIGLTDAVRFTIGP